MHTLSLCVVSRLLFLKHHLTRARSRWKDLKVKEWRGKEDESGVGVGVLQRLDFRPSFIRSFPPHAPAAVICKIGLHFLPRNRAPLRLTGDLTPFRPQSVRPDGVSLLEHALYSHALYLCDDHSSPPPIPRPP